MSYMIINKETEITVQKFSTKEEAQTRCNFMNNYHRTNDYEVIPWN